MPAEAICEQCGAHELMLLDDMTDWHKPRGWTQHGSILCCSMACWQKYREEKDDAAEKVGRDE